jgi:phage/plasmid primase-like uncharacterized protein
LRLRELELDQPLNSDGEIHRCNVASKEGHSGRGDGAYLLRTTGVVPFGGYQNWCDGKGWQSWSYKIDHELTASERLQLKRELDQAKEDFLEYRRKVRAKARAKAKQIWDGAAVASERHRYCRRKQITPYGLKQKFGKLLVPFYDENDRLANVQFIGEDGSKNGLRGGQQSRCHFWIKEPEGKKPLIYLVEGWATGASICAATGAAVLMAFNDHNLEAAASYARERYPQATIIVAADDDWKTKNNPGLRYGKHAAKAVNGLLAIPRFDDERSRKESDFNDMHVAFGLDEVRRVLAKVKPKLKATTSVTAWELAKMDFPPLKYVVPDLIVEGLTIFAGKPKIGKSWFWLQVGHAVASGGNTLGGIRCKPGTVLYCALEDNHRRLQWRLDYLGIEKASKQLYFRCELPRLDEGGIEVIRDWLDSVERPRLVIIDTYKRVKPRPGEGETQYDADANSLQDLHELAQKRGVAIVVVNHQRKMDADDPFDTVSGTLGLTATPDTIMLLRRDSSGTIILQARGRDVAEIEKAMTFDKDNCHWRIAGEVAQVRQTAERAKIIRAMETIGEPAKPNEIAAEAGVRPANVNKMLVRMVRDNVIYKYPSYGKYGLEPPAQMEASD